MRDFLLGTAMFLALFSTTGSAAIRIPWAGSFVDSASGLTVEISSNGNFSTNFAQDHDTRFPSPLTTMTGEIYNTTGRYTYSITVFPDPPQSCNLPLKVAVAHTPDDDALHVEFTYSSGLIINCNPSFRQSTDHFDLIRSI